MTPESSDYRGIILERLKQRNKQCVQFERIFDSYKLISDNLNVALKNSRIRQRNRSTASNDTALESESVAKLQQELDNLCRQKVRNDQELIDKTKRLEQVEQQLRQLSVERDEAITKRILLEEELKQTKAKLQETDSDRRLVSDELLALQMSYKKLQQDYVKADNERTEFLERIKECKSKEIELINLKNAFEEEKMNEIKKRLIQEQIAAATSDLPALEPDHTKSQTIEHDCLVESFEVLSADGTHELAYNESMHDILPSRCNAKFEQGACEVHDVLWHPNGKFLFTANSNAKVTMWEVSSEQVMKKCDFLGANKTITRLDIDIDARYILAASADHSVRIWTIENQRQFMAFTSHTDKVNSAKFLQTSQVVSASNDRTLILWDLSRARSLRTYFAGSMGLDVTCDNQSAMPIVSCHSDKQVRFWDTRSPQPVQTYLAPAKATCVNISHDTRSIFVMSRDESIIMVDLRSLAPVHIYSAEQFQTTSDTARFCISPNSSYVAAGSTDGQVIVWDVHTTKTEKVLRNGHSHAVLSTAWHPKGRYLASVDRHRVGCIWA